MRAKRRLRALQLLIRDATASLLLRPGHTIGMVSGITLGVASALAAVVIADTQQAQVNRQFDLQRSRYAIVKAQGAGAAGFSSAQLRSAAKLEPVRAIGEFSTWQDSAPVSRSTGSTPVSAPVLAADAGGLRASGTTLVTGAGPQLLGADRTLQLAWIGRTLAATLGVAPADGHADTDSQIVLDGVPFSVAGVISNRGGFGYVNNAVVVSRPVAVHSLGGRGDNVRLVARVRPGSAGAVAHYLLTQQDPTASLALLDVTPKDGTLLVGRVGSDLRTIGAALGLFIGLVGMIAIANTLMMSVHQRRRELGLRSAIGWSRRRIGMLILAESAMAGLVAGLIGSGAGLLAAATWCWLHGWALVMSPALPFLIVGAGVLASLLGGIVPAVRAASSSPLEAMRS